MIWWLSDSTRTDLWLRDLRDTGVLLTPLVLPNFSHGF